MPVNNGGVSFSTADFVGSAFLGYCAGCRRELHYGDDVPFSDDDPPQLVLLEGELFCSMCYTKVPRGAEANGTT